LNITRPDITFAVRTLNQFMEKPTELHMEAVFQLLRYLKNSPGKGIMITNDKPLTPEDQSLDSVFF